MFLKYKMNALRKMCVYILALLSAYTLHSPLSEAYTSSLGLPYDGEGQGETFCTVDADKR